MSPSKTRANGGPRKRPPTNVRKQRTLPEILLDCFEKSRFDDLPLDFAPEGAIDNKILNRASVLKTMKIEPTAVTDEEKDVLDFILTQARKLFVIAVHARIGHDNLYKAMKQFKDNNFNDDNGLPIDDPQIYRDAGPSDHDQAYGSEETDLGEEEEYEEGSFSGDEEDDSRYNTYEGNGIPPITEEIFENEEPEDHILASFDRELWDWPRLYDFYQAQFKFLSPCFSTDKSNYDLAECAILPFTSKDPCGEGAFGQVSRVRIHKSHFHDHDRPGECPEFLAIKHIAPRGAESDHQKVIQNWEGEAKALKRVNELKQLHIIRFITAIRRGNPGKQLHYLLFEWADGGSLRNIWLENRRPTLSPELIKEMIIQLRGLADALVAVHNLELGASYRHGDLKPENILCFKGTTSFGTLKIGDWGLAKQHNVGTEMRSKNTSTTHSTIRYDPPEISTGIASLKSQAKGRISRLCDIWAMGCIILEFMIWMMYGYDDLVRFNASLKGKSMQDGPCYQTEVVDGVLVGRVHDVVVRWIEHMAKDPLCAPSTAMGDLLAIVKNKLLVVKLPPGLGSYYSPPRPPGDRSPQQRPSSPSPGAQLGPSLMVTEPESDNTLSAPSPEIYGGPYRALATVFRDALEDILGEHPLESNYWSTGIGITRRASPEASENGANADLRLPSEGALKKAKAAAKTKPPEVGLGLMVPDSAKMLDKDWDFHVDNRFAREVFAQLEKLSPLQMPQPQSGSKLCDACLKLNFWSPGFIIVYQLPDLRDKAKTCDLCNLFWLTAEREKATKFPSVQFERIQSSLRLNGVGPPAFSIFQCPNMTPPIEVQIGLPELPKAASPRHFEIMRQWLKLCDEKHPECRASITESRTQNREANKLPTRLVNVGKDGDDYVRLWETSTTDKIEYMALSHPWGDGPHFSTTMKNYEGHKHEIKVQDLPPTFRDAVTTTRALGLQHLWIDSICIIQGPGGDFNIEAKRMESVFSMAYCVIAASRSHGHFDGFLQDRDPRKYVTVQRTDGELFYICENIDDFRNHVLEGDLNKRGWVLQEHALARRTIFFTEKQTYWECGAGVRCETMTKMTNDLAAFLGDPNFPKIFMSASQGEKIVRYQDLYKQYSRLAFTEAYDRAIAIDGLQNRLVNAFGAKGGFGVFDEGARGGLLRRSLLWHLKPGGSQLTRIIRPPDRSLIVPSWSWMAYTGEIDYLQLDFDGVEWEQVRSPWNSSPEVFQTVHRGGNIALSAVARNINPRAALDGEGKLFFDMPRGSERTSLLGVVLGIQKDNSGIEFKRHYLLLVTPTKAHERDGSKIYERVGVGYLPGKCVGLPRGPPIKIH